MRLTIRQMYLLLLAVVLVSGVVLVAGTVATYRHLPPVPATFR